MVSVPAEPFIRLVDEYLSHYDRYAEDYEVNIYEVFAEKVGITERALKEARVRGCKPGARMAFNLADQILCSLRLVHYWHTVEEYAAIYAEVELTRNCIWCGEPFETTRDDRTYCSVDCGEAACNDRRAKNRQRRREQVAA